MDKFIVKTYAFIGLLSHDGVINQFFHLFNLPSFNLLFTTGAFLVVASYIYIPFMILPIFNSMKAIPNNLLQASSDLGASPFYTFRKVIMPLTKEGVMTGIQVTFIPSLSLFMITRLIAGNKSHKYRYGNRGTIFNNSKLWYGINYSYILNCIYGIHFNHYKII